MTKEELMRKAIQLSDENVANGGGPFGAVIVKDGEVIATGMAGTNIIQRDLDCEVINLGFSGEGKMDMWT